VTNKNQRSLLALGALGATLLLNPQARAAPGSDTRNAPARPTAAAAPVSRDSAPVSLHLQDTPLRTALQTLFAGSGLQYEVELAVPNYPITLDIRDVPLTSALRTLVRLAPGVTYRKEGQIFIIGMRPPAVEPTASYAEPAAPVDVVASAGGETWEKIPINYLHPAVVAYILNGRLVPNEMDLLLGGGSYGGGFSGAGGGGYLGGLNGGGLGSSGIGGLGYGNSTGYGQYPGVGSAYPGTANGFGQGINNGYGTPLVGNGGVVVGPQPRRF
jgi:hypothetical protein